MARLIERSRRTSNEAHTKKMLKGILAGVGLLLIVAAIFVAVYAGFPGKIKETPFQKQVATAGLKSTFRQGIAYRYPGLPPLLDVSGDPMRWVSSTASC